ncbi:metallophosphoesterase family protein [Marinicella sp. W31]|uniref:metallophosphoesterase family protein n=1 Tax=Marinicella sp. W31 TaxID=3023713 RepID=UPI003756FF18
MKVKTIHFLLLSLLSGLWVSVSAQLPEQPDKKKFRFVINSDPQMGGQLTDKRGLKLLNALLEDFVADVNESHDKDEVAFVVYNGDLVWDPYQDAFDNFTRLVSKQKPPTVLVHGNHDGYDDDPKFFQAQQTLSGYQKLNYSFAYGDWRFVVIGAQEKYRKEAQKEAQLAWIRNELEKYKNDKVMLFMHYHIMPVGLSQTEYYSYYPIDFRNQVLDTITEHGNVKYVFNGHVHTGVKASIKSSLEYKGTTFINAPTPVFARMFGEEYAGFSEIGRFDKRGFYMEVEVDGDEVRMIGRKINNAHTEAYPEKFKQFKLAMDPRSRIPEARSKFHPKLLNGGFEDKMQGWKRSYRYKKDDKSAFRNNAHQGHNKLNLTAAYGSWSFDEYMETYQLVAMDANKPNRLSYDFKIPKYDKRGSGGYVRVFIYGKNQKLLRVVLLHWGEKEHFARNLHQSWAYNAVGNRLSQFWLDNMMKKQHLISFKINPSEGTNQLLSLDLNAILKEYLKGDDVLNQQISHMAVAHGVWTRLNQKGTPFTSQLHVNHVALEHSDQYAMPAPIMLNNQILAIDQQESSVPYQQKFYELLEKRKN